MARSEIVRTRAAVLEKLKHPLQVRAGIEVPELLPGQVLVKLAYAGVCHSQLMEARGHRGDDPYLPHMLGHEGSGVVFEIGSGVTKVRVGERVVLGWIRGLGAEVPGTTYRLGQSVINAGAVTTFSEYAVVSENRCTALPKGIPMDVAVLFGCAIPTGMGIVTNLIQPAAGSSIAIFGLGGIGLSALMACRLHSLSLVAAVDVEPDKLALAGRLGATHLIDARKSDPVAEIRRLTDGKGADFSVEAAGLARTIEQAFNAVRRGGGMCVFASHPKRGETISLDPYELISGKRIAGSWGGGSQPDRDTARFAEHFRSGRLPLGQLMGQRYRLEEINAALDDLERRRTGRPIIEIDSSLGRE